MSDIGFGYRFWCPFYLSNHFAGRRKLAVLFKCNIAIILVSVLCVSFVCLHGLVCGM